LAGVLTGEDGSERDFVETMRKDYGDDIDDSNWLQGFIDGALKKYGDLKSKLD
jgi:hypothetical protein